MILALGITTNDWVKRGIAIAIMACIASVHVFTKNWGVRLMVRDPEIPQAACVLNSDVGC